MDLSLLEADLGRANADLHSHMDQVERVMRSEGRSDYTPAERATIERLASVTRGARSRLEQARHDGQVMSQIDQLVGRRPATSIGRHGGGRPGAGWGDEFAMSAEFRDFITQGGHRRSGPWTSPAIEISATTLTEDPGSAGGLVIPQYLPQPVPLGSAPIVIADLFAQGQTTTNTVHFVREKSFTNAADAVPEGGLKPESAIVYEPATSPVVKYAHYLPVSTELLEDVPAMAATIDGKLRQGLELKIDDALLNGSGVTPAVKGILAGTLAPDVARGTDTNIDAIKKQVSAIYNAVFLQPDAVVLNPVNMDSILMEKNSQGNYLVPSVQWLLQFWGVKAIAVSPVTVAGTAVVGCGGIRIEATNSHQDWFVKNLVAVLGESRFALTIFREDAFGRVTGLN
jgi:HK97 family phage major capsid protein